MVFICSPYRGDIELNTIRAKRYCRFAYTKGTVPYAPHLHNTQFLQEDIPEEREAGITLGLELLKKVDEMWIFSSYISSGMAEEIKTAQQFKIPIKYFNDKCQEVFKDE